MRRRVQREPQSRRQSRVTHYRGGSHFPSTFGNQRRPFEPQSHSIGSCGHGISGFKERTSEIPRLRPGNDARRDVRSVGGNNMRIDEPMVRQQSIRSPHRQTIAHAQGAAAEPAKARARVRARAPQHSGHVEPARDGQVTSAAIPRRRKRHPGACRDRNGTPTRPSASSASLHAIATVTDAPMSAGSTAAAACIASAATCSRWRTPTKTAA